MKLVRFQWPCKCQSIKWRFQYCSLCFKSLFYNDFDSSTETVFAPVIICVDFVLKWFGKAFVTLVACLITSVVVLFYQYVMPYVFATYHSVYSYLHILYGHYLLMMIVFHYYKSVSTNPGNPPVFTEGVSMPSICKKCILPKPPRAHHCSVCKTCRLKMDHHCPWINNCVGHFNHRYFISFCIFMLLGTIYVSLSSWVLFSDCFHFTEKINFAVESFKSMIWSLDDIADEPPLNIIKPRTTCTGKPRSYNTCVVFLWILCSAVTLSLGFLTVWHIYLISVGETSIENLVNKRERERLKKKNRKFINRYHFGIFRNWKYILGFYSWRSFIRRVLLPSLHLPLSDGVVWEVTNSHKTCLA